ncbi:MULTISPECIES: hypothetical protein [Rhizobium/Agrobacterium group]|uniref:hypothetical protein n=1 Tax=Rhizobium/Agrobacterium group TaxID=227290 RepID=UPI0018D272A0|nr:MULTISPECIES: hypothetical protein [Rhizobium/Agrobacterium group]
MIEQKRRFTDNQTYQWTTIVLSAVRSTMDELNFNEIVPAILSSELEPGAFHSYAVIGDRFRPEVKNLISSECRASSIGNGQRGLLPAS